MTSAATTTRASGDCQPNRCGHCTGGIAVDHGVSNAVSSRPPIRSSRSDRPVRVRTPPPKRCRPRAKRDTRAKPTHTTARTRKIRAFGLPRISKKAPTNTAADASKTRTNKPTLAGFGSSHGGGLEDIAGPSRQSTRERAHSIESPYPHAPYSRLQPAPPPGPAHLGADSDQLRRLLLSRPEPGDG